MRQTTVRRWLSRLASSTAGVFAFLLGLLDHPLHGASAYLAGGATGFFFTNRCPLYQ
jgi:hypothetical protein